MNILLKVWELANNPAAVVFIAGVLLYLLNRLYAKKPAWQAFEGTIISAIKFAEKTIPDDVPNKAAAKLDEALRYVLKVYAEVNGKRAAAKVEAELTEGIQIVHNKLEASGTLKTPPATKTEPVKAPPRR